jgi:hypothetical protein
VSKSGGGVWAVARAVMHKRGRKKRATRKLEDMRGSGESLGGFQQGTQSFRRYLSV